MRKLVLLNENSHTNSNNKTKTVEGKETKTGYSALTILNTGGKVGIGTTTPGTELGIGTGSNFVNISSTATSTFSSGVNINTGCYAIGGTCLSSSAGTVT